MYANLKVTVTHETGETIEHYAHEVEVDVGEGVTTVHLDANDGESNYAVEAGKVQYGRGYNVAIRADF